MTELQNQTDHRLKILLRFRSESLLTFFLFCCHFVASQNFITQWNLATPGSGATQLSFGTETSGTANYTWQEISPGSATGSGSWSGATLTVTGLPAGSIVRLLIAPANFRRIVVDNGADRNRLIQVENWGSTAWTTMLRAFYGCSNIQITATDVPNLSAVTDMSFMFTNCSSLNSPSNINTWNTAAVTNMENMFARSGAFNQNIGSWNTSAVSNMRSMFEGASAFNQNIGAWNTSAVTTMRHMFQQASVFNQNIGSWNTSAVTDMGYMFYQAIAFNQNIGAWNTAAVTDMQGMFWQAAAFNQDIGAWNTSAVTDMYSMFAQASAFNQNIGLWNTAAVTNMSWMFYQATAFNGNIGPWNTGAVIVMARMFEQAIAFNQNIGAWNTSTVISMHAMFQEASAFNQNIGSWNTAAVTEMGFMFYQASAFNQNIGAWNTTAVTDMFYMFYGASAFNQNLGSWNTAAVTGMFYMFYGASVFNQNIGTWNIANVTDMTNMLSNSGLSISNYDATLTGWATQTVKPNVPLGANGLSYCNAASARATLTSPPKNWVIVGDILSTGCTSPLPVITSFSPTSGSVATVVNITGSNFSLTPANNIVKFNGVTASVPSAVSPTSLAVTVPIGATTGPISVTVGSNTATSSTNFIVNTLTEPVAATVEIIIYNAVSPNDDNKNEVLFIENLDPATTGKNTLTILNRWGTVVFEATNYDNTSVVFRGLSSSGSELPAGTYYYILEFSSGATKRTGFISLRK